MGCLLQQRRVSSRISANYEGSPPVPSRRGRNAPSLIRALEQTVPLDGLHVQADASIGMALAPEHGRELETVLRHADIPMYRAKHAHAGYML